MTNPKRYRDKVIQLTRKAGGEAMKYYREDYSIEEKQDDSPVTEADLSSERILIEGLKETGYGIVAEERGLLEGDEELGDEVYWIVDPLDGTQDFIDKTGEFSVMVGLLVDRTPVFGVVFAPARDKLWYGARGSGAYLVENGNRSGISVADKGSLSEYNLIASRNHFSSRDKKIARQLGVKKITRMGSLGIKFCSIAEGRADLAYYTTDRLGIWDCCAPQVILEEAGGATFDVLGGELKYDISGKRMTGGVVGVGGETSGEVIEILKENLEGLD